MNSKAIAAVAGTGIGVALLVLRAEAAHAAEVGKDLTTRVREMEAALAEYGIGAPEGWTDRVDEALGNLEQIASILNSAVDALESGIASLNTAVAVNAEAIRGLEERIENLERDKIIIINNYHAIIKVVDELKEKIKHWKEED